MGEKTLVDDPDRNGLAVVRASDIFYSVICCSAVYLHFVLI